MVSSWLNISGTVNAFRLLLNPRICEPRACVATFNDLLIPLPDHIKAIVIDKDNCISYPNKTEIWREYEKQWSKLKKYYPQSVFILSNTAGSSSDHGYEDAKKLENSTGVPVIRHKQKKPGCYEEILEHLLAERYVESPKEVAVVGDRLLTDIMMSNMMGAYSIWISHGVKISNNPIVKFERLLYKYIYKP